MTSALVNAGGLVVIGLIVWWFWLSTPRRVQQASRSPVDVVVADGVYTPAVIEARAGDTVTLRFLRTDPGPCAEKVIFSDLGVSADLAVGSPRDVVITPVAPGDYEFTCQMGMYRGRLIVR
ncbi:MAG: putative secreted protein containing plastocyanin domain [Gammaproteobacteria bacterium]|nr:MAG: putative secreted protein containing plastocyanin domain [Gammaproteobacteria bacterium]TND04328.1 MAG: putative secreted protein containing plastocyanin domain [Gammaproteobacteria bacterium]